ncbi:MAG: hypothetical protein GXO29_00040 [Thermotogae bacterium]|nr:hypothetical protein [Thermotogota bacterium]
MAKEDDREREPERQAEDAARGEKISAGMREIYQLYEKARLLFGERIPTEEDLMIYLGVDRNMARMIRALHLRKI